MFHWLVVGHFDPLDPVDTSDLPHSPKVFRPIPLAQAEEALTAFGHDIRRYLYWDPKGYVQCDDTFAPAPLHDRVWEFAYFLAKREFAVVMNEQFCIFWPRSAAHAQQSVREEPSVSGS